MLWSQSLLFLKLLISKIARFKKISNPFRKDTEDTSEKQGEQRRQVLFSKKYSIMADKDQNEYESDAKGGIQGKG